jgi:hypothetical protein
MKDQVLKFKSYIESLKPDYSLQSVTFYVLRDDGFVDLRNSPFGVSSVNIRGVVVVYFYTESIGAQAKCRYFHQLLDWNFSEHSAFKRYGWELSIESNGFESEYFCFCIRNAEKGLSAKTRNLGFVMFFESISKVWPLFVGIDKVKTQEELDKAIEGVV